MGASTDAEAPPRFPSPLIKPDGRISRILCGAPHNAEDFKQGAMFEKVADTHAADGTLLKIPLC
jgi:hypothetical protein